MYGVDWGKRWNILKSYLSVFIMQSEFDASKLKDGYFQAQGADGVVDAVVEDGALVSVKEPRAHDLYANMKDLNARNCVAYEADAPIFGFVDYVGVSHADVMGVNYRIGDSATCC